MEGRQTKYRYSVSLDEDVHKFIMEISKKDGKAWSWEINHFLKMIAYRYRKLEKEFSGRI